MRIVKILLLLVIVVVAALGGFSYWLYSSLNSPVQHKKATAYIKIEKGSTPREIIARLAGEGIISSETATMIYLRTVGDASKLQAGEYQFPSPISTMQVFEILKKGEDRTVKLTIPEGFTRFDIAKRINERFPQNPPVDDKALLALMDDVSLIKDIAPTVTNLEGYMYPSTYNLPRDAKPPEIIKMMVEEFKKKWKPEWSETAKALGRTPNEIVTIASLIETETGVETERPIVAGIMNNRLTKQMPLGIDQTNVYVAKMRGVWNGTIHKSDLEIDSPYNTRKNRGLPPGPISSVSESSIKAVLKPTSNDYLFYVRNVELNDGSHWFYSSASEFEKGKAKYQQWLEQQRQEKRTSSENTSSNRQ